VDLSSGVCAFWLTFICRFLPFFRSESRPALPGHEYKQGMVLLSLTPSSFSFFATFGKGPRFSWLSPYPRRKSPTPCVLFLFENLFPETKATLFFFQASPQREAIGAPVRSKGFLKVMSLPATVRLTRRQRAHRRPFRPSSLHCNFPYLEQP